MKKNVLLALLLSLCALAAFAQTESATISGRITDPQGAVVADADVQATNIDTSLSARSRTNSSGIYVIPNLPPGNYRITVKTPGFKEIVKTGLVLHIQDTISQNFSLEVGSTSETVTVTAGAEMVNTQSAAVGTVVDRQFVENQPMNGRSFQSLLTLVPGVVAVPGASVGNKGEFSINGQRTEENYYTVDGVSANSGSQVSATANATAVNFGASGNVPGTSALGTTQSLVSLDALQEFRIQTSTYSAEFGRTPGGQIAFVTRSGTDNWHGSAFDYLRNGVFDANSWFNNKGGLAKTAEKQNDFGGTLGGPIIIPHFYNGHNRTFFFFSYEGLRVVTPVPAVSTFVPTAATRAAAAPALQQYMAAYPLPNGPNNGATGMAQFVQAYSAPGSLDNSSLRIDHRVSNNFTIFARASDSPSQTMSRASLSNIRASFVESKTLTLGATNVFTSHLFNELRYNYTWNYGKSDQTLDNFGGAVPFSLADVKDSTRTLTPIVDAFSFNLTFGGNANYVIQSLRQMQRQYNIVDSISYTFGRHSMKFGVDFRNITTPLSLPHASESTSYANAAQTVTNTPTASAVSSYPGTPLAPVYKNFSLFVQDEWKTTRRLTLSMGLRWDVNPAPSDANGHLPPTADQLTNLATTKLNTPGTPFWNTTYGNFAPRFGVAYQLRQSPGWETVVRGGVGLFYDTGNTYASFPYNGIGVQSNGVFTGAAAAYPLTTAQLTSLPAPSLAVPYSGSVYLYDPNLTLPYTLEWNTAVQQGLGRAQTLTVSYVGAAARNMLYQYMLTPNKFGNTNFSPTGNNQLTVIQNKPSSDYDAMQVQFQRRMSHGLQAMVSYTWSHAIDEASSNNTTSQLLRGNSAFDVRHNFQAAVTYEVPRGNYANPVAGAILRHWAVDSRITGRSSLPIDLVGGSFIDTITGLSNSLRVDLVPGQPFYLYGAQCAAPIPQGNGVACPAGGRALNFNAFTTPTATETANHQYGNAPRNFLRGYDAWQADLAIRREFPIHENFKLQFRAEAFNITNHPIFGAVQTLLSTGALAFGQATGTLNNQLGGLNSLYQQGGPRSLQFALKLLF